MSMNKITVSKQLIIGGVIATSLVILLSMFSLRQLNELFLSTEKVSTAMISSNLANKMRILLNAHRRLEQGMVIAGSKVQERNGLNQQRQQVLNELETTHQEYLRYIDNEKEKQFFSEFLSVFVSYKESTQKIIQHLEKNEYDLAQVALTSLSKKSFRDSEIKLKELVDLNKAIGDSERKDAHKRYNASFILILIFLAVSLTITIVSSIILRKSIIKSLGTEPIHAKEIMERIANGNLSQDIDLSRADSQSLLTSIKSMQDHLKTLIARVTQNADQLSDVAHELATSTNQVIKSSQGQSQAAMSIASSIEELTASIESVAENTNIVNDTAQEAGNVSKQGTTVVQSASYEMMKIAASVVSSTEKIKNLERLSNEIEKIANVIQGIADQTNLLALNASIEAARAGEQGKGFSVVADEVRKLAEHTGKATREITNIIDEVKHNVVDVVESMELGRHQAEEGLAKAQSAVTTISGIHDKTESVSGSIKAISEALKEQSSTSNEVSRNVTQITSSSEHNSQVVGKMASSAERLENLAKILQESVKQFKL